MAYAFNEDKSKAEFRLQKIYSVTTGTRTIPAGGTAWFSFYTDDPLIYLQRAGLYLKLSGSSGYAKGLDVVDETVEYGLSQGDIIEVMVQLEVRNTGSAAVVINEDGSYIFATAVLAAHIHNAG